jgi:hypothetical protein
MSIKDQFYIKPISNKIAMDMVKVNHYLHRQCPSSFRFGLFDKTDNLIGVVIYGTPSSATLRSGICGESEKYNVIELTRLWIKDGTPKNVESFLVGNTLRLVDKEIIVSFADPSVNHLGVIYQATNFYYTGLSAKRTDWKVKGLNKHSQTIGDKYTVKELREKFGENFYLESRPQKHRYIFFNCNTKRRDKLLAKLRYPILPYPKKKTTLGSYPRDS